MRGQSETGMDYKRVLYAPTGYCHIISTDYVCGDPLWQGIRCHTFRNVLTTIDAYLSKSHGLFLRVWVYIFFSTADSISHWSSPRISWFMPWFMPVGVYRYTGIHPISKKPPWDSFYIALLHKDAVGFWIFPMPLVTLRGLCLCFF